MRRGGRRQPRQALVQVVHEDEDGRRSVVLVPPGHEHQTERGIPVGPPDLGSLGLPEDIEIELQNQLTNRGLLTYRDIRGRGTELTAALHAAFKVSANKVMRLYTEDEPTGG